jgi:integrase
MTAILPRVEAWLRDSQLEASTLTQYVYSLGLLVRSGIDDIRHVNRPTIKRFCGTRLLEGVSAETVSRNLAALCSFLGWLEQLDEFPLDELNKIRTLFKGLRNGRIKPPDFLTVDQFGRLRDAAETVDPVLSLAVSIGVHSGLRLEELRSLWRADFVLDVPLPFVRIQRTHGRKIKTKKERTPPIAAAFAAKLSRLGFSGADEPVFPRARLRRSGEAPRSPYLSTQTLQSWLREASKAAGIRCNWLTLRHTYASWLVQQGVSITKVAKFLGNGITVCFQHYSALIPGGDQDVERGFVGLDS